jgi:hypothetical protein
LKTCCCHRWPRASGATTAQRVERLHHVPPDEPKDRKPVSTTVSSLDTTGDGRRRGVQVQRSAISKGDCKGCHAERKPLLAHASASSDRRTAGVATHDRRSCATCHETASARTATCSLLRTTRPAFMAGGAHKQRPSCAGPELPRLPQLRGTCARECHRETRFPEGSGSAGVLLGGLVERCGAAEKAAAESSDAPPASDAPASVAETDSTEPEGSEKARRGARAAAVGGASEPLERPDA